MNLIHRLASCPWLAAHWRRPCPSLWTLLLLALLSPAVTLAQAASPATGPSSMGPAASAAPAAPPTNDVAPDLVPRIGVVTMAPGTIFFERFGHDAIVVVDPRDNTATSYNFGYFDPSEPDFVTRFIRGEMMYYLVALPLDQDLSYYEQSGRGASIQWLDLEPAQALALEADLQQRARPENARYRYDYYTANCATMVRDTLDKALGGTLHAQLSGRSRGNTYRSESVRLASPAPWMWLGFDLGLGPFADQPLSRWQEAFVPMRLAAALDQARTRDGRPLVAAREQLLPHRLSAEPTEQPRRWWPWLLVGLLVAAGAVALRSRPRLLVTLALPLWLFAGVAGSLLTYLWGFSDHHAAWGNRNLLQLSPLALLALPGAISLLRGRVPGRMFRATLWLLAGLSLCGLVLHWLSLQPQYNVQWIVLLLPVHVALAWMLGRPRLPAAGR